MKQKLEVGQTVWIRKPSYRHGQADAISERTIQAIGRKWVTTDDGLKYSIDDGLGSSDSNYRGRLYDSMEVLETALADEKDRDRLRIAVRDIRYNTMPIEKVRAILSILQS